MIFWARFIYIKTQFYKTEGIAYGKDNHYFSEFLIRDDKGYNYVGWVSRNIFSPLHTRGAVYTIYVNKNNPKNAECRGNNNVTDFGGSHWDNRACTHTKPPFVSFPLCQV